MRVISIFCLYPDKMLSEFDVDFRLEESAVFGTLFKIIVVFKRFWLVKKVITHLKVICCCKVVL
jgi:hypothetical protein